MISLEWLLAESTDECREAVQRSRWLIATSRQKIRRTQTRLEWDADPWGPAPQLLHASGHSWRHAADGLRIYVEGSPADCETSPHDADLP